MDMDFTSPAATSTAAAATTTFEPPAAAVVVAGPLSAAAWRQLPFPPFAAASSTAPTPPCRSPPSPPAAAAALKRTAMAAARQGPAGAGADAAVEDRMDLLWEDFNEELARGLWPESSDYSSDAESEPAAARGCAPALRPSSRAGAARHCRRRAGTWVLLIRIFRRLFVIEKTVAAATARAS
jgi:hypothetical protein